MKIFDEVWEWVFHKEKDLVYELFSFGEALEFLNSEPEKQLEYVDGECPYIEAWYGSCHEVLNFKNKLNNHSFGNYYDKDLLESLNILTNSFDSLTEKEYREGDNGIFYLEGWSEIRKRSKLPLKLIEWPYLKSNKDEIFKML